MRRIILFSILLALLLFTVAAYSVAINLEDENIAQLGATDAVQIICPDKDCTINKVYWELTGMAPYKVDKVVIEWDPHSGKEYTVCVELYDKTSTNPFYGQCKEDVNSSPTKIELTNPQDPKDIERIKIVIMEEVQTG